MQCYICIQLTSENIHLIYSLSRLESRNFIAQGVESGTLRARNMLSFSLPLVKSEYFRPSGRNDEEHP